MSDYRVHYEIKLTGHSFIDYMDDEAKALDEFKTYIKNGNIEDLIGLYENSRHDEMKAELISTRAECLDPPLAQLARAAGERRPGDRVVLTEDLIDMLGDIPPGGGPPIAVPAGTHGAVLSVDTEYHSCRIWFPGYAEGDELEEDGLYQAGWDMVEIHQPSWAHLND